MISLFHLICTQYNLKNKAYLSFKGFDIVYTNRFICPYLIFQGVWEYLGPKYY
nr:MAG TPA: hypothetical protein [Crassvirales sp.]